MLSKTNKFKYILAIGLSILGMAWASASHSSVIDSSYTTKNTFPFTYVYMACPGSGCESQVMRCNAVTESHGEFYNCGFTGSLPRGSYPQNMIANEGTLYVYTRTGIFGCIINPSNGNLDSCTLIFNNNGVVGMTFTKFTSPKQ